jgi:hypothetical protein
MTYRDQLAYTFEVTTNRVKYVQQINRHKNIAARHRLQTARKEPSAI